MTPQVINSALARKSAARSESKGNRTQSSPHGWNQTLQQVQSSRNTHNAEKEHKTVRLNGDKSDNNHVLPSKHVAQRATRASSNVQPKGGRNALKGHQNKKHAGHNANASKHKTAGTTDALGSVKLSNKGLLKELHRKKHDPQVAAAMVITAAVIPSNPASPKQTTTDHGIAQGKTHQPKQHHQPHANRKTGVSKEQMSHPAQVQNSLRKDSTPNGRSGQRSDRSVAPKSGGPPGSTDTHSQPSHSNGSGGNPTVLSNANDEFNLAHVTANRGRESILYGTSDRPTANQSNSSTSTATDNSSSVQPVARIFTNPASDGQGSREHSVGRQITNTQKIAPLADHKAVTSLDKSSTSNKQAGQSNVAVALATSPDGATSTLNTLGAGNANGGQPISLTPQSIAQLNAQIHSLHQTGGGSTRIDLHPGSLGPIQIHVQMQNAHQAQVTFNAAHSGTAQAIQASLPQLASSMQQQGIQLSQPQVNSSGDADTGQTPNGGQQSSLNPTGQQAQGQSSQGQHQHSRPHQPITRLPVSEAGPNSSVEEMLSMPRSGIRAYA